MAAAEARTETLAVASLANVVRATRQRVRVWEPEQLGAFLDAIADDSERLYPKLHLAA